MTKKLTKRFISFMVTLAMVMAVMPIIPAMADEAADEFVQEFVDAAQGEEVAVAENVTDSPVALMAAEAGSGHVSGEMTNEEFLAAADENGSIVLDDDVTIKANTEKTAAALYVGGKTIDLGTHALNIHNYLLVPNGDAVIKGKDNGRIYSDTQGIDKYALVQLQSAGSLTVEGGTIDGGTTRYAIWGFGTDPNSVTIKGGTVTGALGILTAECCSVNIEGGTVKGTKGVGMQNGGEAKISGGTVMSSAAAGILVMGHLVVEGNSATIKTEDPSKGAAIQVNATKQEDLDEPVVNKASAEIKGGTITGKGAALLVDNESNVTITGGTFTSEGTEKGCAVYIMDKSTVDIKNATITGDDSGIFIAGDSEVTVGEGATITGKTAFGISTNGTGDKTSQNYGANAVININGGTVNGGTTACGIYLPAGTANVTGGTIKGGAGIVVRGGDLDVQGGTIEATGTSTITVGDAKSESGERYPVPAAGITVDNANYPAQEQGQPHVTISDDATVTAPDGGKTLAACKGEDEITAKPGSQVDATENPFSVSGGTFTTGDGTNKSQDAVNQFLAKNYEYNENGIEYKGTDPEVTLDGVQYGTLEDAIAAASNGSTIKLIENVEIEGLINITKAGALTINLNGKNITRKPGTGNGATVFYIKENGNLTIEGEGTVTNDAAAVTPGNLILVEGPNAQLTINGGTFTQNTDQVAVHASQGADVTVSGGTITGSTTGEYSAVYVGGEGSTFTMTGGKIKGTEIGLDVREKAAAEISGMADVSGRYGAIAFGGGQMTVSGGTVHGTAAGIGTNGSDESEDTTITVSGGTVSGDVAGVYLPHGTMTVKDDAKIEGQAGIVQFGGDLTVDGGTITANGTADVKIGDSDQAVPPAAVATNKSDTGSYGTPSAQLKGGKFEAADGKDAVTYTENGGDAEGESALTVEGGNYSAPVDSNLLSNTLNYEAKSTDPDTPYSYHAQKNEAETAAGAGGTVEEIIKDADSTAVILNGDSKITEITKTTDEDNNEVVNITVSVGKIGATEAGSAAGDAQKGDAAFWVGIGLVAPTDFDKVDFTRYDYPDYPNKFTPNNGNGSLDGLKDGKQGFGAWVNVGGATTSPVATQYTLKWYKTDGTSEIVTYTITFKDVALTGAPAPFIDEVGFNADAAVADAAIEAASGKTLNDVIDNTMYAVFHLQGKVKEEPVTNITAAFSDGTTTYTEPVFTLDDNDKHVVYFSFDDLGDKVEPEGNKLGEGQYTVTVTAATGENTFHTTASLDVYKVVFEAENGKVTAPEKPIYVTSKKEADKLVAASKPEVTPDTGYTTDVTWSTEGELSDKNHTITYTATCAKAPVVAAATIADKDGDIKDIYTGTPTAELKKDAEGKIDKDTNGNYTIVGTATDLKSHTNGNNEEGNWFGITIEAPEDITDTDGTYTATIDGDEKTPSSFDTLANGKKGAVIYFNVKADESTPRKLKIKWSNSKEITYNVDLKGVELYDNSAETVVVKAATIADSDGDVQNVVGAYEAKYEGGKIVGTAADLKKHHNSENEEAYWFGVEIQAPDDVVINERQFDVTIDTNAAVKSGFDDLPNIGSGKKGVIIYFKSTGKADDTHTVTVKWGSSKEVKYTIDLSAVKHYVENPTVAEGNTTEGTKSEDYKATVEAYTQEEGYKYAKVTFTTEGTNKVPYGANGAGTNGNWVGITVAPPAGSTITGLAASATKALPVAGDFKAPVATQGDTAQLSGYYVDASKDITNKFFFVKIADEFGNETVYCYELTKGTPLELEAAPVTKYTVTCETATGGTVKADKTTAAENETVTLTVTPNSGYRFSSVSVKNAEGDTVTTTAGTEANTYTFTMPASNVTVTATFRKSGGGGGSSSGSSTHSVSTPSKTDNGSVKVSSKSASKGSKVTITVNPDKGYKTGSVVVKDANGNILDVTDNGDGTYSFVMPDTKVSVETEFVPEGTETPSPEATPSPEPTPAPDAEDNCPSEKFVDVDQSLWYHEGIDYALTNGLMSGTGDTTFEPDSTTTRAMIVSVLYRLDGSPEVAAANFTDVPEGAWYTDAVAWGEANGVVSGYDAETFGPDDYITREQMAAILYRYAQYKGIDVSAQADLSGYSDADTVSDWADTSLSWANAAGIVSGISDTELAPTETATRAQVASILMRFCENIVK